MKLIWGLSKDLHVSRQLGNFNYVTTSPCLIVRFEWNFLSPFAVKLISLIVHFWHFLFICRFICCWLFIPKLLLVCFVENFSTFKNCVYTLYQCVPCITTWVMRLGSTFVIISEKSIWALIVILLPKAEPWRGPHQDGNNNTYASIFCYIYLLISTPITEKRFGETLCTMKLTQQKTKMKSLRKTKMEIFRNWFALATTSQMCLQWNLQKHTSRQFYRKAFFYFVINSKILHSFYSV